MNDDVAFPTLVSAIGMFGQFCTWDTEYTAWEGSRERDWAGVDEYRELVRIGVVRWAVDDRSIRQVQSDDFFVRPMRNPILSDYFKRLTHISQHDVDTKGLSPHSGICRLYDFIDCDPAFSFGADSDVVRENIELNGLTLEESLQLYDIRPWLKEKLALPDDMESGKIAKWLGRDLPGKPHLPVFDSQSLCFGIATALGLHWAPQIEPVP